MWLRTVLHCMHYVAETGLLEASSVTSRRWWRAAMRVGCYITRWQATSLTPLPRFVPPRTAAYWTCFSSEFWDWRHFLAVTSWYDWEMSASGQWSLEILILYINLSLTYVKLTYWRHYCVLSYLYSNYSVSCWYRLYYYYYYYYYYYFRAH